MEEIRHHDPIEEFLAEKLPVAHVHEFPHRLEREQERKPGRAERHAADGLVRPLRAEQAVDRAAQQRKQRNDPQLFEYRHYSLSRSTRSTFKDRRLRWIRMMMPSPTAASAAATTMTNSTKTCPSSLFPCVFHIWLNATNARFSAFSISSMDMKIVMIFRRKTNETAPIPNRIALRIR